ncbi:MAG TPA: hypothetical protein PKC89_11170 [Pyrinomonadaceae bacterium]|nr:hypothetical protein [Pyrinomonadaceae bacterium]
MNTKTAISIPPDVFRLSEKLAKRLKISRSAVFALGVKKLSEEHDEEELITRINAACAEIDTSVDPTLRAYQARRLKGKNS